MDLLVVVKTETYLGYSLNRSSDSENTFMNARYDLAYAGFDASSLAKIRNVFARLSDDDTGLFCADERAKS